MAYSGSTDPLFLSGSDDSEGDATVMQCVSGSSTRARMNTLPSPPARRRSAAVSATTPTKPTACQWQRGTATDRSMCISPWTRSFRSRNGRAQLIPVYPCVESQLSSGDELSSLGTQSGDEARKNAYGTLKRRGDCPAEQSSMRLVYFPAVETPMSIRSSILAASSHKHAPAVKKGTGRVRRALSFERKGSLRSSQLQKQMVLNYIRQSLRVNVPAGDDVLLWDNGVVFVGEAAHNQPHGNGAMIWPTSAGSYRHQYFGQFVDGNLCGFGEMEWSTGKRMAGNWNGNVVSGYGSMKWPTGDRYEGLIENNVAHGKGEYTWLSGDKFLCDDWVRGRPNGESCHTYADGRVHQGDMIDGQRHGSWMYRCKGAIHHSSWWFGEPVKRAVYLIDDNAVEQASTFV